MTFFQVFAIFVYIFDFGILQGIFVRGFVRGNTSEELKLNIVLAKPNGEHSKLVLNRCTFFHITTDSLFGNTLYAMFNSEAIFLLL